MKIKQEIEIKPFTVPNFVILNGSKTLQCLNPSIPIENLDVDVLSELCIEFRANVFKKCDKKDPLK